MNTYFPKKISSKIAKISGQLCLEIKFFLGHFFCMETLDQTILGDSRTNPPDNPRTKTS